MKLAGLLLLAISINVLVDSLDIYDDEVIDFKEAMYQDDLNILWNVHSKSNHTIEITIQAAILEKCKDCVCDYLLVNYTNSAVEKLCGTTLRPTVHRINDGDATIQFVTDNMTREFGFYIVIRYLPDTIIALGTTSTAQTQTTYLPTTPTPAPFTECADQIVDVYSDAEFSVRNSFLSADTYCGVHVHEKEDWIALVTVRVMNVNCSHEEVFVNGLRLCYQNPVTVYMSGGIAMYISSKNLSSLSLNISVTYHSITTPMPTTLTTQNLNVPGCNPHMSINDDYNITILNDQYRNDMSCLWNVVQKPGHYIEVRVDNYDIQGPTNGQMCDRDFLGIEFDMLCGQGSFLKQFVDNVLSIYFITNSAITSPGFVIQIRYIPTQTTTSVTTIQSTNTSTTPNVAGACGGFINTTTEINIEYKNDMNCVWTLQQTPNLLYIKMRTQYSIELSNNCMYDHLRIVNVNGDLMNTLCGVGTHAENYVGLRQIVFYTDESTTGSDFKIYIYYVYGQADSTTPRSTIITTPMINITTPVTNATTPITNVTTPITNVTTPITNVTTPITNVTTPITNVTTPITNITTPITNVTTPITNVTTPITNLTTPIINVTTPITNVTTPIINITTPITNITTPTTNATTPITNVTTPTTNATTPTTNATTSISNTTTPVRTTLPDPRTTHISTIIPITTTTTTTVTTTTPTLTTTTTPTDTTLSSSRPEGCDGVAKIFNGDGLISVNRLQYVNNMDCRWMVNRRAGHSINIRVYSFDLENNLYCNYDYLVIKDKKKCGRLDAFEYNFFEEDITITFHSDRSRTEGGFKLQITYTDDTMWRTTMPYQQRKTTRPF